MSSQTLTMAADAATEHPINTGLPLASEGRLSNTLLDTKNASETSTLESKHIFEGVGEQTDGEVLMDKINQSYTEHQRPYEPIAKTLEAEKENSDPRGQHFSTIDSKEIQVHPAQKALVESDLSTVPSSDYAPVTVESAVHDTMTLPAVDVPEIGTKLIGNADVHVARPIGLEQRCYSTTCKESQRCYSFVCLRQNAGIKNSLARCYSTTCKEGQSCYSYACSRKVTIQPKQLDKGVIPSLVSCYSFTCQDGQSCYSYLCPRRTVVQTQDPGFRDVKLSETLCYSTTCKNGQSCYSYSCPRKTVIQPQEPQLNGVILSQTSCYSTTCKAGQPCYAFACPRKGDYRDHLDCEEHEDALSIAHQGSIERPWTPSYSVTIQGLAEAEASTATEDIEEIGHGSFLLDINTESDSSNPQIEKVANSVDDLVGADEQVSSQQPMLLTLDTSSPVPIKNELKSPWTPSYSVSSQGVVGSDSERLQVPSGVEDTQAIQSSVDEAPLLVVSEIGNTPADEGATTTSTLNPTDSTPRQDHLEFLAGKWVTSSIVPPVLQRLDNSKSLEFLAGNFVSIKTSNSATQHRDHVEFLAGKWVSTSNSPPVHQQMGTPKSLEFLAGKFVSIKTIMPQRQSQRGDSLEPSEPLVPTRSITNVDSSASEVEPKPQLWSPSYSVTSQGSVLCDQAELSNLEQLSPNMADTTDNHESGLTPAIDTKGSEDIPTLSVTDTDNTNTSTTISGPPISLNIDTTSPTLRGEQDRPKSPGDWTPSYSVMNQGSPMKDLAELDQLEQLPPSITQGTEFPSWTPSYSVSEQGSPMKHSAQLPSSSVDEPAESSSWTPSYSVNEQGNPMPKIVQLEELPTVAVDHPKASSWTPSYSVSEQGSPLPKPALLEELPPVTPEEPQMSSGWTPSYSVSEQGSPIPKPAQLEQVPSIAAENAPKSMGWTPSYSVSEQGSPIPEPTDLTPRTVEEPPKSPSWTPSYSVNEQRSSMPKSAALEELSVVIVEDHSKSSGWTPSYSVSEQGSPMPKPAQLEEPPLVAAEQFSSSSGWTPSYSVSEQGSPMPKPAQLEQVPSIAVEGAPKSTGWTPSYSVSAQGSPMPQPTELPSSTAEEPPKSPSWTPSYSVSEQGSPMPKSSQLQELSSITVDELLKSPDWTPSYSVSEQGSAMHELEKLEQLPSITAEDVPKSSTWTPSYSVMSQGSPLIKPSEQLEGLEDLEPLASAGDSPRSPGWTPSYSVNSQGNSPSKHASILPRLEQSNFGATQSKGQPSTPKTTNTLATGQSAATEIGLRLPSPSTEYTSSGLDLAERPSSPSSWPVSYSVTSQGSVEALSDIVEQEERPKSPSWLNSYSVMSQGPRSPGGSHALRAHDVQRLEQLPKRAFDLGDQKELSFIPTNIPSIRLSDVDQGSVTSNMPEPPHTPRAPLTPTSEDFTIASALGSLKPYTFVAHAGASEGCSQDSDMSESELVFPTIDASSRGKLYKRPSLNSLTSEDEDEGGLTTSFDLPSASRKRHESSTSSRFVLGGWNSSTPTVNHKTTPSLDFASGEFIGSLSTESPSQPALPQTDEEEKGGRWCTIM